MATENPMRMMASSGGITLNENVRSSGAGGLTSPSAHEGVAQELGMLLRSHNRRDIALNRKDVLPYRSGSAPPSVQGSLAAAGTFLPAGAGFDGSCIANQGSSADTEIVDSEQELRADPAYLAYYYSHINLNPRLPPPIISRDNYFLAQRLAASNFSDMRKLLAFDDNKKSSLFSAQPALATHNEEAEFFEDEKSPIGRLLRQVSDNWAEKGGDVLPSSSVYGLSARPKSLVDLIQQDFPRTPSPVYNQSRSSSRLANEEGSDIVSARDALLRDSSFSGKAELSATLLGTLPAIPIITSPSRSATPSNPLLHGQTQVAVHAAGVSPGPPGLVARLPTPEPSNRNEALVEDIPGMDGALKTGARISNSSAAGAVDLDCTLQTLTLSGGGDMSEEQQNQERLGLNSQQGKSEQLHLAAMQQRQRHVHSSSQSFQGLSQIPQSQDYSQAIQQQQQLFPGLDQGHMSGKYGRLTQAQNISLQQGAGNDMYAAAAAAAAMSYMGIGNPYYPNFGAANMYAPQFVPGSYSNPGLLPGMMANYTSSVAYENAAAAAVAAGVGSRSPLTETLSRTGLDMQHLIKHTSQAGTSLQSRIPDLSYLHYLQQRAVDDLRGSDPTRFTGFFSGGHIDPLDLQKGQIMPGPGYHTDHKAQFSRSSPLGIPIQNKSGSVSPVYYGSPPSVGFAMPYGHSPLSSPLLPGSPVVPGALSLRHGSRATSGGAFGSWQGQRASDIGGEDLRGSSLLEELKNSKNRRFELADIAGNVVEFSADQHGSRFIQQKLETASVDEKALVFAEILPRALSLMTDVFGNYVIQKFFEHGSQEQRLELARQLIGHVLSLSLQMYGCRVIQKALEVVDLEQQISIVSELDSHVMRCVRDQNGNHVIQKCIECVPPEHIQFIITAFYGQVVMLSTHPYGCRVIQRVLEHCTDEQKQDGIMEDILRSACNLAQDQYGNYVVQHVLEHGKPHEKSEIMMKLAGQIVQMSQHKFASNVVEKCLEFGGPSEREILICEMLGHTDENEPLQAMMKDQYANYVVQKVLETCDDQQRELLLSRIRVHLHALKKYTYGKHIVARVEKLVAAGERRGAQLSA